MKPTTAIERILIYLTFVVAITTLSFMLGDKKQQNKQLAYVRLSDLFQGYDYTKNQKARFESVSNAVKLEIDSLKLRLESLSRKVSAGSQLDQPTLNLANMMNNKIQQLEKDLSEQEEEINETIWNQLNAEVKEFGKQEDYELIMGAKGDGGIMYGAEPKDITEDLLSYLNEKFKTTAEN
jgi:outer membrane protein